MMTALLGLLLFVLVGAPAHAVTRDLEVCLDFRKDFADAKGGDWWTDNTTNAKGRGVLIEVNDDTSTNKLRRASESTGCTTFSVEVSAPSYNVVVRAIGDAVVSGVQIHSYEDDLATSDPRDTAPPFEPAPDLADDTRISTVWTGVQVTSDPSTMTRYLPETGPWMHLAVATMVFRRSDFNITDPVSRDCCTDANNIDPTDTGDTGDTGATHTGDTGDPSYDKDGTCTNPDYKKVSPPVRIHHGAGCGGSDIPFEDGVELDPGHPGAALNANGCPKFVVAHELGHVIEMMRTGARTPKNDAAPDGQCSGEGIPYTERGRFTKEYMSSALREGWGDFIATWTWNKRTESDCTFQKRTSLTIYNDVDFNLDGTIDNEESIAVYDGMDDCHGTPFVHHDTALPMDNTNWLDDLQDTAYAYHCDRHSNADKEANRSTVYDVAKMFWQLNNTNGQSVPIEDLVDLYVDMCRRRWAVDDDDASDDGVYVDDELPLERLKISASANGLTSELTAVLDHVEH